MDVRSLPHHTRLLTLALLVPLAWWPGGGSRYSSEPVYNNRIPVINTVKGNAWYHANLRAALEEWNQCHADVHLELTKMPAYSPGTITIFVDPPGGQEPAYGGWSGTYGIVAVGGGWTRTRDVLAHELGHALGFGHTKTFSVMGSANSVQPIDCQGLIAYYGR